jgi:hypothetical protein
VSTSKSTLSAGCEKPNPPDEPIGLMKRPARDAAHAQENLDSIAPAAPGERFSHAEHMMARVSTAGPVELDV